MGILNSVDGTPLEPDAPAIPCGLIARSFFNDSFSLYEKTDDDEKEFDLEIPNTKTKVNKMTLNEKGIAWETDVTEKFKN